jgi:hypothetical protein
MMMMTDPAAVIRQDLRQLTEMQIDTFARPTSLTNSDLNDYLRRSAQIKQLRLALDAIRKDLTLVLRPTRKGRRARWQLGSV